MRVEAGGDDQKLWLEAAQCRQHDLRERGAKFGRSRPRWQRRVDDIAGTSFRTRAGAGIERRLMRRGIQHARFAPENILGAVAVVHVEIHNRNALDPACQRVRRADGDMVEQAETHRRVARRVMAGRAHRAERARGSAVDCCIDCRAHRAGGAQCRLKRIRRHHRVRIKAHKTLLRCIRENVVDECCIMHTRQLLARCSWRFGAGKCSEGRIVQRLQHRLQTRRRFRMTGTGAVTQTRGMGVERCGHVLAIITGSSIANSSSACCCVNRYAAAVVFAGTQSGNGVSSIT